jgi:hypothetical protein
MILTKIEIKSFKHIYDQLEKQINYSALIKLNEFYDEDCEDRIDIINEMILLLNNEKDLINDLLNK